MEFQVTELKSSTVIRKAAPELVYGIRHDKTLPDVHVGEQSGECSCRLQCCFSSFLKNETVQKKCFTLTVRKLKAVAKKLTTIHMKNASENEESKFHAHCMVCLSGENSFLVSLPTALEGAMTMMMKRRSCIVRPRLVGCESRAMATCLCCTVFSIHLQSVCLKA